MTFTRRDLFALAHAWESERRYPEARELRDMLRAEHENALRNIADNFAGEFEFNRHEGSVRAMATQRARRGAT